MNNDVEKLLRSFEGPEPGDSAAQAIFAAARAQAQANAQRRAGRRRLIRKLSIAAVACLLIALAASLLAPSQEPVEMGTVACERMPLMRKGEATVLLRGQRLFTGDVLQPEVRSDISLDDGSSVRIDAGTKVALCVPGENERVRLLLERGRIFVRAASAPGSFIVAGTGEVRVLGTAFSVEEQDARTRVSVIGGEVALTTAGGSIELERGETGAVRRGAAPRKTGDNPYILTLWARDTTRFDNRPLGDVIDWLTFNTSYRFTLPPQARDIRVSITIRDEPIEQVIRTLGLVSGLTFTVDRNDVTVKQ